MLRTISITGERIEWFSANHLLIITLFFSSVGHAEDRDLRAFQHGLDILPLPNGHYVSIWSSVVSEKLQLSNNDEEWSHDVYMASFSNTSMRLSPELLISAPDHTAQEPASSAISRDGHIMVTMEDAYQAKHVLMQSYAVFDTQFNSIVPYQQMAFDGGHSGHVAAVDNHFVIFFSEGWIEGGGVDELGSGDDVLLKTYNSIGEELGQLSVSVGDNHRDWWPILAGSRRVALLLWQRFIDGKTNAQLMYSIYDPIKNTLLKQPIALRGDVQYYTYDVQFLPTVNRFLITGTTENNTGFAYLIDEQGSVVNTLNTLPPFVREAQPAITGYQNGVGQDTEVERVVYPTAPSGLLVLDVKKNSIKLNQRLYDPYLWQYIGTDGVFLDEQTVYFHTLSQYGLKEKRWHIPK
jgi:hypothetical protein